MAKKFFTGIDLQKNQILNGVIHKSATAPINGVQGQIYYNTTENKMYFHNGTDWDLVGSTDLTVHSDSQAFVSIIDGELHFHNLAITGVTVDITHLDLASFLGAEYSTGNELHEGDMVILTNASNQSQRSFIHNGGSAGDSNDFTRLQTDLDMASVRAEFSGGSGISYDSSTGVISTDVDNVTIVSNNGKLEVNVSEIGSQFAGDNLIYDTNTRKINVNVDGTSIHTGLNGLEVQNNGITTVKIADESVDKTKINSNVAGNGLGQDVDGSLEVNVDDSTIKIIDDKIEVDPNVIGSSLIGQGLEYNGTNDVIDIKVDNTTIGIGTNGLELKEGSISDTMLVADSVNKTHINVDVAGNGLGQDVDGSLEVNVDDSTIELQGGNIAIKDYGITGDHINSSALGSGLQKNGVSGELEVKIDNTTLTTSPSGAMYVNVGGIDESKLNSLLQDKINNGYAETFGDGSAITFTISHNLKTKDVMINLYQISTGECIECDVVRDSINTIQLSIFPAIDTNDARILIQKLNA